jgi:hypothetical protein
MMVGKNPYITTSAIDLRHHTGNAHHRHNQRDSLHAQNIAVAVANKRTFLSSAREVHGRKVVKWTISEIVTTYLQTILAALLIARCLAPNSVNVSFKIGRSWELTVTIGIIRASCTGVQIQSIDAITAKSRHQKEPKTTFHFLFRRARKFSLA